LLLCCAGRKSAVEEGREELFGVLFGCKMGCPDGGGLCLETVKPLLLIERWNRNLDRFQSLDPKGSVSARTAGRGLTKL
jgi:hypothetical protein